MGFFGKSIKEKILDFALLAINENEPTKDKFLTFYRICKFDLSFDFKSEDEVKFLEKYKNEPIYPEEYNNVKSHLKAIYVVMIEVSLFIARRDKQISEKDYSECLKMRTEISEEIKSLVPNLDMEIFDTDETSSSKGYYDQTSFFSENGNIGVTCYNYKNFDNYLSISISNKKYEQYLIADPY